MVNPMFFILWAILNVASPVVISGIIKTNPYCMYGARFKVGTMENYHVEALEMVEDAFLRKYQPAPGHCRGHTHFGIRRNFLWKLVGKTPGVGTVRLLSDQHWWTMWRCVDFVIWNDRNVQCGGRHCRAGWIRPRLSSVYGLISMLLAKKGCKAIIEVFCFAKDAKFSRVP